jgi:peptide/nickel transport system substrate-binding protein
MSGPARRWRLPYVRARYVFIAWAVATLAWLAWRVDAVGGRPLTFIVADDPGMYDPHATSDPRAQQVFSHVCEPLFTDDGSGTVRSALAEDTPVVAPDGRTVTVHLRPGRVFHDGRPVDAAAVAASFARLKRLGVSPLVNDLRDVTLEAGADGRSVVFRLAQPDFDFVRLVLASPYAVIVSPAAGEPAAPGLVACTGAYRFAPDLYRPGVDITLVRAGPPEGAAAFLPTSHPAGTGRPAIPRLTFAFLPDRAARLARLLAGAGCVLSLSEEHVPTVANRPEFRTYTTLAGLTYLGFNMQRPRWQDERVRQAVASALDAPALAASGPFEPADTPLAPYAVGYDRRAAAFGHRHDVAQARAAVAAAGADQSAEVVLMLPSGSQTYADLAALVVAQLAAAGWTHVRLRPVPRGEILDERQDFDLLLFDYSWGDYGALRFLFGPGTRNLLGYADDRIADLVTRARATADPDQRQALVLEAQRAILEPALWQPLLVRRITVAVDDRCVTGESQAPDGTLHFEAATTR